MAQLPPPLHPPMLSLRVTQGCTVRILWNYRGVYHKNCVSQKIGLSDRAEKDLGPVNRQSTQIFYCPGHDHLRGKDHLKYSYIIYKKGFQSVHLLNDSQKNITL